MAQADSNYVSKVHLHGITESPDPVVSHEVKFFPFNLPCFYMDTMIFFPPSASSLITGSVEQMKAKNKWYFI